MNKISYKTSCLTKAVCLMHANITLEKIGEINRGKYYFQLNGEKKYLSKVILSLINNRFTIKPYKFNRIKSILIKYLDEMRENNLNCMDISHENFNESKSNNSIPQRKPIDESNTSKTSS